MHKAAKAISTMPGVSEKHKKLALKRLHRLHKSNPSTLKGTTAAKKDEEKKWVLTPMLMLSLSRDSIFYNKDSQNIILYIIQL